MHPDDKKKGLYQSHVVNVYVRGWLLTQRKEEKKSSSGRVSDEQTKGGKERCLSVLFAEVGKV